MAFSIDVKLPRDVVPVFPDACCGCGRAQPGDSVTVKGRRIRWAELFLPWLWFVGKRVRVTVPTCAACRPRVLASRHWNTALLLVNLVIAVPFAMPLAKSCGFARGTTKVLGLAFVFVGLLPYVLWSIFRPPLFDITVWKDHIDYEFGYRPYAVDFLHANEEATSDDLPSRERRREK